MTVITERRKYNNNSNKKKENWEHTMNQVWSEDIIFATSQYYNELAYLCTPETIQATVIGKDLVVKTSIFCFNSNYSQAIKSE